MFRRISVLSGLVVVLGWVACAVADDAPTAEVSTEADVHADLAGEKEKAGGKGEAGHDARGAGGKSAAGHAAAGHGDEHAHFGAAGANSDILELRTDLAIWTFCVFALLMLILWKFAWGPISAGLAKREAGIRDQIHAAQMANEEGKQLLVQYEKKLENAQNEVRAILDEARRDAQHTKDEIVRQARLEAQAEKERALREIETATDGALKQLAEKSANMAIDLAGKIVQQKLSPSDHAKLVQDAVSRFGSAPSAN